MTADYEIQHRKLILNINNEPNNSPNKPFTNLATIHLVHTANMPHIVKIATWPIQPVSRRNDGCLSHSTIQFVSYQ